MTSSWEEFIGCDRSGYLKSTSSLLGGGLHLGSKTILNAILWNYSSGEHGAHTSMVRSVATSMQVVVLFNATWIKKAINEAGVIKEDKLGVDVLTSRSSSMVNNLMEEIDTKSNS